MEEALRSVLLLMPQVIARIKRGPLPEELRDLSLGPRHLPLLAYLLYDGPMTVNELAGRLEVAPATTSLMLGELASHGLIDRRADTADRRRTIVSIAEARRSAVERWLSSGALAWRRTLEQLTPPERRTFIETLRLAERAFASVQADEA